MAKLLTGLFYTAVDLNGNVLPGAKLEFFTTGTSTPLATYTDNALTVAHTNPVVADSAGRFAPIYLSAADYKAVLTDASDVTIKTIDPVHGVDQEPLNVINIVARGATGDGSTDDRSAIQTALDAARDAGGGIVWVPPVDITNGKYYRLAGKPLQMRDNVILMGAGPASLIRNDDTSGTTINEYCILFGFAHPDHTDDTYTKYPIADTSAGDLTVTLDTAINASNFTVGQLIVVLNGLNYTASGQPIYHDYILTRVTSVDSGTGVVGIEHSMETAFVTSGAVSPQVFNPNESGVTFDHGFAAFMTQRAGLVNVGLQSEGSPLARGGSLESYIGKIWSVGETSPAWGNLYAHCTFENIWARVGVRFIELKEGCHDNIVRNIRGQYDSGLPGTPVTPIDLGESARNNTIDSWRLNMGDVVLGGNIVQHQSCKHNKIINGKLEMTVSNGTVCAFTKSAAGSPDDMRCEGNVFSHNVVTGGVALGRYWDFISHSADAVRRNWVEHNRFLASVVADAGRIEGTENYLLYNFHQDGRMNWASTGGGGATKNFVIGNVFPDQPNPDSGGLHDDLAKNYAWLNVDSTTFDLDNDSERAVRALTADFTIPDQANGMGFTNEGASGTVTITLPPARFGKRFSGHRVAAQAFRFDPNGTEQIRQNNGTLAAAGKYLQLGAVSDYVELVCLDQGIWFLAVEVGTTTIEL